VGAQRGRNRGMPLTEARILNARTVRSDSFAAPYGLLTAPRSARTGCRCAQSAGRTGDEWVRVAASACRGVGAVRIPVAAGRFRPALSFSRVHVRALPDEMATSLGPTGRSLLDRRDEGLDGGDKKGMVPRAPLGGPRSTWAARSRRQPASRRAPSSARSRCTTAGRCRCTGRGKGGRWRRWRDWGGRDSTITLVFSARIDRCCYLQLLQEFCDN
jgi:hypothetical protein